MRQTRIARNIWLGIENLLLHKLRSFLTMLGVVFGVGSVVAMLSVGEGASKEALEQIKKLGSNNIIISSKKSAEEEATSTQHSHMSIYGLTYEDYRRVASSFEDIQKTAPVKLTRKDSRLHEKAMELRIVGTTPEWFELVPRQVLAGRVLLKADQDKQAPVAVLTEFGARKILATESTIGQTIRIGSDQFEVIGIVKSESGQAGNIQIPDQEVDAYVPIEVARRYFGDIFTKRTSGSEEREMVELHQMIVQVDDPKKVEAVAAGIERMLKQFHKKEDYVVSVPLALLKQAEATKRTFNIG
jgi:putative ABC transport system permease protein